MLKVALFGGAGLVGSSIGVNLKDKNFKITSFDFKESNLFDNFILSSKSPKKILQKLDEFNLCILAIQKQPGAANNELLNFVNKEIPYLVSLKDNLDKVIYITSSLIDHNIDLDNFSISVFEGENDFLQNNKNKNFIIIRPGNIINNKIPNYFKNLIDKLFQNKPVLVIGKGQIRIQFTILEDLANYVAYALKNETPKEINIYSTFPIKVIDLIKSLKINIASKSIILKIPMVLPILLIKFISIFDKNYYPLIRIRALTKENLKYDDLTNVIKQKNPIELFQNEFELND